MLSTQILDEELRLSHPALDRDALRRAGFCRAPGSGADHQAKVPARIRQGGSVAGGKPGPNEFGESSPSAAICCGGGGARFSIDR
jgi:hypothetical protein